MKEHDIQEVEIEVAGGQSLAVYCFDCNGPTVLEAPFLLRCRKCGARWSVEFEKLAAPTADPDAAP